MSHAIFRFPERVLTDFEGLQVLCDFYDKASRYRNCTFVLDWETLQYLEANLSSLILAMVHKLRTENNINFFLDYSYLKGPMNVFWRNGLAHYIYKKPDKPNDYQQSTIPVKAFRISDVDSFVGYIEKDLLQHRGVESLQFQDMQRVKDSYLEIFCNVDLHAKTTYPVLACGQFFPKQGELKFTLVDLGVGFLHNIKSFTHTSAKPITKSEDAIKWAIAGNSTKVGAAGGTGLNRIWSYCRKNNGGLHICTDGCYWAFDQGKITNWTLKNYFVGTTISLIFRFS